MTQGHQFVLLYILLCSGCPFPSPFYRVEYKHKARNWAIVNQFKGVDHCKRISSDILHYGIMGIGIIVVRKRSELV